MPNSLTKPIALVKPISYAEMLKGKTVQTKPSDGKNALLTSNRTTQQPEIIAQSSKPATSTSSSTTNKTAATNTLSKGKDGPEDKAPALQVATAVNEMATKSSQSVDPMLDASNNKKEISGTLGKKRGRGKAPKPEVTASASDNSIQHKILRHETNGATASISREASNDAIKPRLATNKDNIPSINTSTAASDQGNRNYPLQPDIKEGASGISGDAKNNRAESTRSPNKLIIPVVKEDVSKPDTVTQQIKVNPKTPGVNTAIPEDAANKSSGRKPYGNEDIVPAIERTTTSLPDTINRHHSNNEIGTGETLASGLKTHISQGIKTSPLKKSADVPNMPKDAEKDANNMEPLNTHLSELSVGQSETPQQKDPPAIDQEQDANADDSSKPKKKRQRKKKNKSLSEAVPVVQFEGPYANGQSISIHPSLFIAHPHKVLSVFTP